MARQTRSATATARAPPPLAASTSADRTEAQQPTTALDSPTSSSADSSLASTPASSTGSLSLSRDATVIPSHHKALSAALSEPALAGATSYAWSLLDSHAVPTPADNEILVKTSWVGLNPVDWQGVEYKFGITKEQRVMGRDGAGVVVSLGSKVNRFKLGDRVWYCSNSARSSASAFQHYSAHDEAEVGRIPDDVEDEAAATLGTGVITAGVALFKTLALDLNKLSAPQEESDKKRWFLVWGGAGITGIYLIQLAKLAGYRVICAASPVNYSYIKSLGADVVLNRWDAAEDVVEGIRKATGDAVALAVDNVGKETATLCERVLAGSKSWRAKNGIEPREAPEKAKLVAIAGSPKARTEEEAQDGVRSVEQARISFSTTFYGHPEFSVELLDKVTALLESGQLKPARTHLLEGGLSNIVAGLDDLKRGRVPGGHKLVCRLDDEHQLEQAAIEVVREEQNELKQSTKRSLETDDSSAKRLKSAAAAAAA